MKITFRKIWYIFVIVVVVWGVAKLGVHKLRQSDDELVRIHYIVDHWDEIQQSKPPQQPLNAKGWHIDAFNFLKENSPEYISNLVLVSFEDGHVVRSAIFLVRNDQAQLVATINSRKNWDEWIKNNKNLGASLNEKTYVLQTVQDGEVVIYNEWTPIMDAPESYWF